MPPAPGRAGSGRSAPETASSAPIKGFQGLDCLINAGAFGAKISENFLRIHSSIVLPAWCWSKQKEFTPSLTVGLALAKTPR